MLCNAFTKLVLVLLCHVAIASAQPHLLPDIGLAAVPGDNDPICQIPVFTGDINKSGLQIGDTIPEFRLFTLQDESVRISEVLSKGKPVLLVGGSITCPVFRNRMPALNQIYQDYHDSIEIYLVYVVEAHPITDPSPYSGKEWVTSQNQSEGVLFRQPTTYGERKSLVEETLQQVIMLPEIIIDGPCNYWWQYFGPAPNNAILIRPDGIVESSHGWFNRAPLNMAADIRKLLSSINDEDTNTTTGSFNFSLDNTNSVSGAPGEILEIHSMLENTSTAPVNIEVIRSRENLPASWKSAMCLDVCLADWIDTTSLYLYPGSKQSFTLYFYTGENERSGAVEMRFTNTDNRQNSVTQRFFGETKTPTSISLLPEDPVLVEVFPNPSSPGTSTQLTIRRSGSDKNYDLAVYTIEGKKVLSTRIQLTRGVGQTELSTIPGGTYIYLILDRKVRIASGRFIVK
jgi:iodothyronine deiodinase-like protein